MKNVHRLKFLKVPGHQTSHKYKISRATFLRRGFKFDQEDKLLRNVENCGSLSPKYTELYVNSIVGELTLETTDYEVTDHTKELEDSGECKTTVDLQKQIDLGENTQSHYSYSN